MLPHATGWLAETHLVHVAGVANILLICPGSILFTTIVMHSLNCVYFCFQVSTHCKRCPKKSNAIKRKLQWTACWGRKRTWWGMTRWNKVWWGQIRYDKTFLGIYASGHSWFYFKIIECKIYDQSKNPNFELYYFSFLFTLVFLWKLL